MSDALQQAHPPLHEFVFKVASRCNLACDYCYVYTGPDQSWRQRPRVMSPATIDAAAARIGQHARAHRLDSVLIALHGGEPLLAGPEVTERVITAVRAAMPAGTRADLIAQTNGVLLDRTFLELFARHGVRIGVSLDGSRQANDRHRQRAHGGSSYPDVVRALRLLDSDRYRPLFAGVLCTIDLENDPVETYRALLELNPPVLDFLLPHANWSHPPPGRSGPSDTPYADWLIPVFDAWYGDPAAATSIRFFDEIIQIMLGGVAGTEAVGGGVLGFAVVETDGTIEGADSLKSAYHGAAFTGLSVHAHSFDEALGHPVIAGSRRGRDALGATCRSCPVVGVCGGGQYAHRYRAGAGFGNPSVYCADLRRMIEHVAGRVHHDLSQAAARRPCSVR
jgi:uncharacterized protein